MREVLALDVGGADISGSYREIFNEPQFTYIRADVAPTEGVSLILKDPHRLTIPNFQVSLARLRKATAGAHGKQLLDDFAQPIRAAFFKAPIRNCA